MITPPDSSLVEDAVTAILLADPVLQALCPDGVWWDAAGITATRFVVISFATHTDEAVFGGRGAEVYSLYIRAVMLNASSVDIRAAALRLDELLDDQVLDIPGYAFGAMYRTERVRYSEKDAEKAAIRWLHRGGHYRIEVGIPDATFDSTGEPIGRFTPGDSLRE